MTTYSWATQTLRAPTSVQIQPVSNTFPIQSELSSAVQTIVRPGDHVRMTMNWENIHGAERAALIGFFARLNGAEHRVLLPLIGHTQRGALSGAPLVQGGGQTGNSLDLDGAGTVTNWIRAGDWIEVASHLYMATADADASAGNVTVPVIPSIKQPANNTVVKTVPADMLAQFILMTPPNYLNNALAQVSGGGGRQNLALEFMEDVLA